MPNNRNTYGFNEMREEVPRWFRARPRIVGLVLISLVIFLVLAFFRIHQYLEGLSSSTEDIVIVSELALIMGKIQVISTFADVINHMESISEALQTARFVFMVLFLIIVLVIFCVWFAAKERPSRR